GYTHSLDAIKEGIHCLEHVWISPYDEFCALDMRFGPGASMMDPKFWTQTLKGWEEADLQSRGARTWFDAMVEHQVNMGTTLDLLWIAKCGSEGAQHDPDRRYIPPAVLARQKAMAARLGERPARWPRSKRSPQSRPVTCANKLISAVWPPDGTPISSSLTGTHCVTRASFVSLPQSIVVAWRTTHRRFWHRHLNRISDTGID